MIFWGEDINPILTKLSRQSSYFFTMDPKGFDEAGNFDVDLDFSTLRRTEGWINKKGGAVNGSTLGRRNWKKRWFVLKYAPLRNRPNYQLLYYDQPRGSLKGTVDLQGTEVYCDKSKSEKRSKHEFQLLLNSGNTLYLSCDNSKERDEWLETFNIVLFRLRKTVTTAPGLDQLLKGYDPALEDEEDAYAVGDEIGQTIQAFGPGLFGAEAGQQAQFVLQMYDKDGVPVQVGGLNFTASLQDDECLYHIRINDNDNGTYSAHYVISRPSKYLLHIRLNDEHDIFGSPFHVEVVPSTTIPEKCTCEGACLTEGFVAGQTTEFLLVARDAFGNQKQRGGDVFELGVMGPANLRGLQDRGDGTYACMIDAQNPLEAEGIAAASLLISVTLYGKHVSGSPFRPQIIPAATDGPGEYQRAKTLQDLAAGQVPFASPNSVDTRKSMRQSYTTSLAGAGSILSPASPPPYATGDGSSRSGDPSRSGSMTMKSAPRGPSSGGAVPSYGATSNSPPRKGSAASTPFQGSTTSLSRLEAARQRALQGVISTASATPAASDSAADRRDQSRAASDLSGRLSKLEVMTRQVGASAGAGSASSRRNFQTPKDTYSGPEPPPPPPDSPPSGELWTGLNYGSSAVRPTVDVVVLQDSLAQGIIGPLPARSTSEEQRLLAVVSDAIRNREVYWMGVSLMDSRNLARS
jgi:hypothetical protein